MLLESAVEIESSFILMPGIKGEERKKPTKRAAGAEVAEAVLHLMPRFRILEKANIKKCFRVGRSTIIVTEREKSGLLIGRGGRIAKELSSILGSKVKIIEEGNEVEIAKELASPLNVKGIRIIYSPERNEKYVIVFSKKDREKLKSARNLERTFREITGKDIITVFE